MKSISSWRRPRTAVFLTGLVVALMVAFGVVFLSPITPPSVWQSADGAATATFVLAMTGFAVAGGVIAARRPENPVGWLLILGTGLLVSGALCSLIGTLLATSHNAAGRWVLIGGILWAGTGSAPVLSYMLAILRFPDGRLPSSRWRWFIGAQVVLVAVTAATALLDPAPGVLAIGFTNIPNVDVSSPFGVAALSGVTAAASTPLNFLAYLVEFVTVASVFLRLRHAGAERRHQIRWFGAGAACTVIGITVVSSLPQPTNPPPAYVALISGLTIVAALATPVAIGVAILKYRLYDVDILISRALVYGSLAALITGVYVGIAVGIGEFVGSGGKPNLGLSILATAIVAVGFQPARERLQRIANRLVYGTRATPYQVLSQFSSQVAGSYAADDVLPRMARVLEEGTGAERSTVWLRSGSTLHPAATWPVADSDVLQAAIPMSDGLLPGVPGVTRIVEVRYQGELLGALSVLKRRGEALTPVEEKLLDDLAHQAGLVLKNVGLTADLQRRLEELRASRQRLVAAQDSERQKLERNLHDGAQQHLVALKVKLGLAEMLTARDPEKAIATITQLKADADEALETLRDLARGIYPPLLAEKGLASALASQARKATVPVEVDAVDVGRYPQDIEATVYFCVLEALQNVQKYAKATRAVVRLREDGGRLLAEVQDDGAGFDSRTVPRGAGLTNMHDRLDAISGSLDITSEPSRGTTVRAVVPLEVRVAVAT